MRVGMRKRLTLALARIVTPHGALHGRPRVRRRAAPHLVPAPGAIRATGGMRPVAPLDIGVDAREEDSDEGGEDGAPQQHEDETEATAEAAHQAGTGAPSTGSVCSARGTTRMLA